jgi:hypothetical protein
MIVQSVVKRRSTIVGQVSPFFTRDSGFRRLRPTTMGYCYHNASRRSASVGGCAKTPAFNLHVESSSRFGNLKTKSSGDGCLKKAMEKTVLCFLGSRTFHTVRVDSVNGSDMKNP